METRLPQEEYYNKALTYVENNDLTQLKKLIDLQFNVDNSQTMELMIGAEKIRIIVDPKFSQAEGDILFLRACTFEYNDIAEYLLRLNHKSENEIFIKTIPLTPILLKKVLDIYSNRTFSKTNKLFADCGFECIHDITLKRDLTQHELILKTLFAYFFEQNIDKTQLMIRFFNNVKKYFSSQSKSFTDLINNFLTKLCNPYSREYENPILFENLLLAIPEARLMIDHHIQFKKYVVAHYQLNIIYKPQLSSDEINEFQNIFRQEMEAIFDAIQNMRKSVHKGFLFFKDALCEKLLCLENEALLIITADKNSIIRLKKLMEFMIGKRLVFSGDEEILKKIDLLFKRISKNEFIQQIFTLKCTSDGDLFLRVDHQELYMYNYHLDQFLNEKEISLPKP